MPVPFSTTIENVSRSFVSLIAARAGYVASKPENDFGVDLTIDEVDSYPDPNGATRYVSTGKAIDIQLKATSERYVRRVAGGFLYSLKVRNYNDLLVRKNEITRTQRIKPLITIVFIYPPDRDQVVLVTEDHLETRYSAYMFNLDRGADLSSNKHTIRVKLHSEDLLTMERLQTYFAELWSSHEPPV